MNETRVTSMSLCHKKVKRKKKKEGDREKLEREFPGYVAAGDL